MDLDSYGALEVQLQEPVGGLDDRLDDHITASVTACQQYTKLDII